ncbi:hypothetical protein BT93_H1327 [Corymbia citriodora subsp. variegata]|nr:hypothetical protein BT93_H1327 [Corymbia citriodora subsp. variegata]
MRNHQGNQFVRHNEQPEMQDHVLIYIKDMLSGVPPTLPEHSIFRVHHQLRKVNPKVYKPEILVIGPYHYGNDKFKFMEDQKKCCSADWIRYCLQHDLLLFENQLPLFILNKLYDLTKGDSSQYPTLRESKHLLHLMHTCWTYGLPNMPQLHGRAPPMKEKFMFMSIATELRESRVKLKAHMKDIRFKNGKLEIPALSIQDHTESQFRNLIAYEQHCQGGDINYFTDYVTFMDCLINTSKDVKVLCHAGIIRDYLGNDEMGDYITLSNFYYSEIFKSVIAYCNRRWNVWMAKLRREYFHSPWAFLSIYAAIVLLLPAAAQTIFSILSYRKQP